MRRWTESALLCVVIVAMTAGCSDGVSEMPRASETPATPKTLAIPAVPMLTDPKGLVEFALPEGWAERSQSNAIRFARAEAPESPTVLAVAAEPRDPSRGLAEQRKIRRAQMAATDQAIRIDETFEVNGWQIWESAAARARGPVMHSFLLFSDDITAEVWLVAASGDYATLVEDLRAVALSIRPKRDVFYGPLLEFVAGTD